MLLMNAIIVYPNTESLREDIETASRLGVVMEYTTLEKDITKIETFVLKEPRFNQLSTRELNIEILKSMILNPELNYNAVDYIFFQRIKTPTLCLKNANSAVAARGVSIFIDLDDARIQIHRFLNAPQTTSEFVNNLSSGLPVALAIVIAGIIIGRSLQK